jgi:hypothetical protein
VLLRPGVPLGPLLESFVLSELSRQLTWSEQLADLSHYRDQGRYEVDAVLENRSGHVVGIEVEAATTVGPDDNSSASMPFGCCGTPGRYPRVSRRGRSSSSQEWVAGLRPASSATTLMVAEAVR